VSDVKVNDGGAAFPCNRTVGPDGGSVEDFRQYGTGSEGMSLRDYFAASVQVPEDLGFIAAALMGEQAPNWSSKDDYEQSMKCAEWWATARAKYRLMEADAMLKARHP